MNFILHLVPADYYRSLAADRPYLPQAFAADGFIHCTQGADVLLRVANTFYQNVPGEFMVLIIDESKVAAPVRYEPPTGIGGSPNPTVLFPHIYGSLNREAIVGVITAQRRVDGAFVSFDRALAEWESS
ncbi:MAG TPA: DUF952 domain-containing protein [Anaerolineae bacterium]|nr:DUF952 domain-containing protein [Anaerolineae bacterium]